jgi:hypothetical protein
MLGCHFQTLTHIEVSSPALAFSALDAIVDMAAGETKLSVYCKLTEYYEALMIVIHGHGIGMKNSGDSVKFVRHSCP